jgi:hypothetical protein
MREKRIRTKLFQVWLHPKELTFLSDYAEQNLSTASEIIRGWLHEVMKREGYEVNEPSLPDRKIKKGRK